MKKNPALKFAIVASSLLAAGCASSGFERARSQAQNSTVAYGEVFELKSADTSDNRAVCMKGDNSKIRLVCENLAGYNEARLVFLHSSRFLQRAFFVPVGWKVQNSSILEVNPAGSTIATRLASLSPRQGCEWTGRSLESLKGGLGAAQGFAMGLLIVPAVAAAADDSILQGGVECDGWSYKTLLQNS